MTPRGPKTSHLDAESLVCGEIQLRINPSHEESLENKGEPNTLADPQKQKVSCQLQSMLTSTEGPRKLRGSVNVSIARITLTSVHEI